MKTQKIFLLAAVISLLLMLVACGEDEQATPDCFSFDEQASFVDVTELDGEVLDADREHGLIALATNELDWNSSLKRTVKVYDITDGNRVVYERSESHGTEDTAPYFDVDLSEYPIIKVITKIQNGEDNGVPQYEDRYDYILIQKDQSALPLETSVEDSTLDTMIRGNVYIAKTAKSVYWINRNLSLMRTISRDVADTYFVNFDIKAEWNNYIYTWDFDMENPFQGVYVYNKDGVCTAKYGFTANTAGSATGDDLIINPIICVLNNGDVLVQECVIVEDGKDYDFEYGMALTGTYKLDLVTKVINHETSAVTELDYKDLIIDFESAYSHEVSEDAFPFTLKEGYDNQAIIAPIENKKVGKTRQYVVLTDSLEVKYTLNNSCLAISDSYDTIFDADAEGYSARAYVDGANRLCRFDWNGNVVRKYAANIEGATDDFYFTLSGIYSFDGKLVFNVEDSIFRNTVDCPITLVGDTFYLERYNYETNATEYYTLNTSDGTTTLVCDGKDSDLDFMVNDNGTFVMINDMIKETYSIYNSENELVLVLAEDDVVEGGLVGGMFVLLVEIDGIPKTYILGNKIENEEEGE